MARLRNIARGLRSLFRTERVEGELDEELRAFLEMASEETQAARTAELFYARLWGTKMRSDEERLQRNHHAIPDVFI